MSNTLGSSIDFSAVPQSQHSQGVPAPEVSDVRNIAEIKATIDERKHEFELAIWEMEQDQVYVSLLDRRNKGEMLTT